MTACCDVYKRHNYGRLHRRSSGVILSLSFDFIWSCCRSSMSTISPHLLHLQYPSPITLNRDGILQCGHIIGHTSYWGSCGHSEVYHGNEYSPHHAGCKRNDFLTHHIAHPNLIPSHVTIFIVRNASHSHIDRLSASDTSSHPHCHEFLIGPAYHRSLHTSNTSLFWTLSGTFFITRDGYLL